MALFPLTQFDFPNVSNYDSDLREILAIVKKLIDDYNTLVAGINDLNDGYEEVLRQFNIVKADFAKLEQTVADFENEIDEKVAAAIAVWSDDYIQRINQLTQYVHDEVALFSDLANGIVEEFNTLVSAAYDYADMKDAQIVKQFNVELAEVNERIDELVFELPDVYNITKGYETSFVELVYDVYDATRDHAYTARNFDARGLTAAEFDALNETAYVLDTRGHEILYPVGLVNNPYTGEKEPIDYVLEQIAQAAAGDNAITATEFDALDLSATEFDAKNLTAYMFDMYAKQLLTA